MLAAFASLEVLAALAVAAGASGPDLSARQTAQIPSFVLDYAPLVYLDVNEYYLPSDIGAQITNTYPAVNFTKITSGTSDLSLSDLSSINQADNCTFGHIARCFVYLTNDDETSYPPFLNGTLPNPKTGETEGARSCAIIVNDHGDGTVDAFYMYFYAFNLGYDIYGLLLGNHVGDWEHTMLRFVNGQPSAMWFSQHDSGEVFTYDALSKRNGRPLVYSAIGTHANYAVPGLHSRLVAVVTVNDTTSAGPLWDPIQSAYFYAFTPNSSSPAVNGGTFASASLPNNSISSIANPTEWLMFYGKWGNKQLPDSNPNQTDAGGLAYTWEDGPTGPYDKDLNRNGTCPDGDAPCITQTTLPAVSGDPTPSQTISRPSASSDTTHMTSSMPMTSSTPTGSMTSSMPTGSMMTSSSSSSMPTTSAGGGGGNQGSANQLGGRSIWMMSLGAFGFALAVQF